MYVKSVFLKINISNCKTIFPLCCYWNKITIANIDA